MSIIGKNVKNCVTCQYWMGRSIQAHSPNFIECDAKERAKCTITGAVKATWQSCNKHQKRHNL